MPQLRVLADARERGGLLFGEVGHVALAEVHDRHVHVDAGDVGGALLADAGGHHRAPVATLRAVALVAEVAHERRPTRRRSRGTFHPGAVGLSL